MPTSLPNFDFLISNKNIEFPERKFGVEIEFSRYSINRRPLDSNRIVQALLNKGINCQFEDYNHATRSYWKLTTDSSCGWELVSPPLKGVAGLEEVKKASKVLEDIGAKVNSDCGLHIHVDTTSLDIEDIKNVVLRYAKFEDKIDAFMPHSRREDNNDYCGSMKGVSNNNRFKRSRTIQTLRENISNGRYSKINLESFLRYGTIEFRQHSGTIEGEKIINWIQFCVQFVEATKALTRGVLIDETSTSKRRVNNTKPSKRLIKFARHLNSWSNCAISVNVAATRSGYAVSSLSSAIKTLRDDYGWEVSINKRTNKILVHHIGILPCQETDEQRQDRILRKTYQAQARVNCSETYSKFEEMDLDLFFGMPEAVQRYYEFRTEHFKKRNVVQSTSLPHTTITTTAAPTTITPGFPSFVIDRPGYFANVGYTWDLNDVSRTRR